MKMTTAAAALFLALSSMVMSAANADVIYTFKKSGFFNGDNTLQDTQPFASATFKTTGAGTVSLTMSVFTGLDQHAYVNNWVFNVDPTITSVTAAPAFGGYNFDVNKIKLGGDSSGKFDMEFNFPNANPGDIAIGSSATYILTGSNLTENSFKFATSEGFFSAVKVQGYGNGQSSDYQSGPATDKPVKPAEVPEPGIVALLGLGLLGLAASTRREIRRKSV